jgi:hypothetical protein
MRGGVSSLNGMLQCSLDSPSPDCSSFRYAVVKVVSVLGTEVSSSACFYLYTRVFEALMYFLLAVFFACSCAPLCDLSCFSVP